MSHHVYCVVWQLEERERRTDRRKLDEGIDRFQPQPFSSATGAHEEKHSEKWQYENRKRVSSSSAHSSYFILATSLYRLGNNHILDKKSFIMSKSLIATQQNTPFCKFSPFCEHLLHFYGENKLFLSSAGVFCTGLLSTTIRVIIMTTQISTPRLTPLCCKLFCLFLIRINLCKGFLPQFLASFLPCNYVYMNDPFRSNNRRQRIPLQSTKTGM